MKVVIAGGSGFLGRALTESLVGDGHEVAVLTRDTEAAAANVGDRTRLVRWKPDGTAGPWAHEIDGAGAVINLAGESIAGRRWSTLQKHRILNSRLFATRSLVAAVNGAARAPGVFVSGSAVGYYGPLGDQIVTEERAAGHDFLATVCAQWEAEAERLARYETRLVRIRTGLVLSKDGGALPQMLPPYWLGVGGPIGSGRQYWPWVHVADWIALVRWAIHTPDASGALNVASPHPVPNAAFARALGRALHRPAFVPTPAFAMRILLGEMADALLLSGQRVTPARAERLGFSFRYARLDDALAAIFQRGQ